MLRDEKAPVGAAEPLTHNLCTGKPFAEQREQPSELEAMVEDLAHIANSFGAGLDPLWLLPLQIELMCKDDPFRRGVLTTVAHLVEKLGLRPEGRKALADLGLEPILKEVEGPGGAGLYD